MSYFNLFLRGTPNQELPHQVSQKTSGPFQSVVTYPNHFSFDQLEKEIANCNAPYLIFADTALGLESEDWKQIIRASEQLEDKVFTIHHEGLQKIYGLETWPSCFLAIPRSVYQSINWQQFAYQSLEFNLLQASFQLEGQRHTIELNVQSFDAYECLYRIFLKGLDRFAKDFQLFVETNGTDAISFVPPQYRVTTKHQYLTEYQDENLNRKNGYEPVGNPVFSIICPVFKPNYLQELIDSVLKQNYQNWELILGIDGPPEPARSQILQVISQYDDPRIHHFIHVNQGTGPTRRKLSEKAIGTYLLSVDDDDELTPETLATFSQVIQAKPEVKIFRAAAQTIGLLEEELPVRPRYLINGIPNDPFEVNQPYIIERTLLHEIGGYEWDKDFYQAGEDTILFHKIDALSIPVCLIDRPLYRRRLSTHNLTLQFKVEEAMSHFRNLDQRFCPKGWENADRKFEMNGNFQLARALYCSEADQRSVITATSFFQFQTLGDLSDLTIDLEVTARCNAVCSFCPRDAMPDTRTHVSLETVRALADNLRNGPRRQVVLCGIGESLLHPKLIEIVEILKEAGAFMAMTSNGALMTEKKFLQLIKAGVLSFNFSINSATAETHKEVMGMKNFEKVMKNIKRTIELKKEHNFPAKIHASFVVCETNEEEVFDFVDQWRDSGVDQVWLHPINNRAGLLGIGTKSSDMERFSIRYKDDPMVAVDIFKDHEEKENLCKIAKSLAFISSNGEMRLCAMDYKRLTSHGNINQKSLQQMHFEKLLDFVRGEYDDFCQGCDFCPGGIKAKSKELVNN